MILLPFTHFNIHNILNDTGNDGVENGEYLCGEVSIKYFPCWRGLTRRRQHSIIDDQYPYGYGNTPQVEARSKAKKVETRSKAKKVETRSKAKKVESLQYLTQICKKETWKQPPRSLLKRLIFRVIDPLRTSRLEAELRKMIQKKDSREFLKALTTFASEHSHFMKGPIPYKIAVELLNSGRETRLNEFVTAVPNFRERYAWFKYDLKKYDLKMACKNSNQNEVDQVLQRYKEFAEDLFIPQSGYEETRKKKGLNKFGSKAYVVEQIY